MAILVINLTIAGLLKLLAGQDKALHSAREQLELAEQLHLRPHSDPLARALGMPAEVSSEAEVAPPIESAGIYELELVDWSRQLNPARLRVVFERHKPGSEEVTP